MTETTTKTADQREREREMITTTISGSCSGSVSASVSGSASGFGLPLHDILQTTAMDQRLSAEGGDDSRFIEAELVALEGLLELGSRGRVQLERKRLIPLWGAKRKRCVRLQSYNYDGESSEEEEEEEEWRKAKVQRSLSPPPRAEGNTEKVMAAAMVVKSPPPPPTQGTAGSPTTPWSANERGSVSSHGDRSDSTNSRGCTPTPPPCDQTLVPKLKIKVERKVGVQNSSNRRGPKKKTHAELKELLHELLLEKEEMEKEKEWQINCIQSLRDQNKHLKGQLALKLHEKEENEEKLHEKEERQFPTHSLTVSSDLPQQANLHVPLKFLNGKAKLESCENLDQDSLLATVMNETSNAERTLPVQEMSCQRTESLRLADSSSSHFVLPDLNIPLEDLSDNSSGGFDNQVHEANNKAAVAAEARKHRLERLRFKQSQIGKVRLR